MVAEILKANVTGLFACMVMLACSTPAYSQDPIPFAPLSQNELAECPAGWSLNTRLTMSENAKKDDSVDRLLVDRRYRGLGPIQSHRTIDGKESKDVIDIAAAGYINIDGVTVISFEIIKLENSKPNTINILASGLGTLEDMHAEVSGDSEIDKVYLDGCLSWDNPAPIEGDEKKLRYTAHDSNQKTATVDIAKNLNVELLPPWRLLIWQKQIADEPVSDELLEKFRIHLDEERNNDQPGEPVWPYKPNKSENIINYRKWLKKIPDKSGQEALSIMVELMDKDVVPTEFPIKGTLQRLMFDPDVTTIRNVAPGFDCKKDHFRDWLAAAPMLMVGNGVDIKCHGAEHIIITGDDNDMVETKDYAFNIWAPGKGSDSLKSGKSDNIVILRNGWGNKTINSACPDPLVQRRAFQVSASPEIRFGGVGLSLTIKDTKFVVANVFKHFPADEAGIKAGDIIVAVDDKSTEDMDLKSTTELIRGLAGTEVEISFLSPANSDMKKAIIRRKLVDIKPSDYRYLVDYKPSFPFFNYIIFENGISASDIEEVSAGEWRNKSTGDVLQVPDCYNFVFAEDTLETAQKRVENRLATLAARRDNERNKFPIITTPASAPVNQTCPKHENNAKAILQRYPVVISGKFSPDGTFLKEKIYKGFRSWPMELGDAIAGAAIRPEKSVILLGDFIGGKVDVKTCGALIFEDGNLEGITFGAVLAEAAIYEAVVAKQISLDISERFEPQKYGNASKFLKEHDDNLYLMELATNLLHKTIDQQEAIAQDTSRHYYDENYRQKCGSQVEAEAQVLTEEMKAAIQKGFKLISRTSGGPTPAIHSPLRFSLANIGKSFLNIREYSAALYTLCGLNDSNSYLIAAIGAKRHDLIDGVGLGMLDEIHDMSLSTLVLKKIRAGGEWRNVEVKGTNFSNADFTYTKFKNVNLGDSIVHGALYSCKTEFPEGFDPVAAHMIPMWKNQGCDALEQPKVNLAGIKIEAFHKLSNEQKTKLRVGYLSSNDSLIQNQDYDTIDLPRGVIFSKVDARNSSLGRIRCSGCVIEDADFTGSQVSLQMQNEIVTISNSSFRDVDLRGSDFHQMNFINVDFQGANLADVNFDRSTFDANTKWPAGFDPLKAGMQQLEQTEIKK